MAKLLLQILGNSDVSFDPEKEEEFDCTSIKGFEDEFQILYDEFMEGSKEFDFPLIRQVKETKQQEDSLYFGIILTNQVTWLEQKLKQQDMSSKARNDIIASDGCWWENILKVWCEQQEIQLFPIPLEIDPSIDKGVADWEGMATLIKERLTELISFENNEIKFHPPSGETKPIDEILIQHSSGTPATSSALYLWGIEKKLAKVPVEFVYISRQDSSYVPHDGKQWQWRFKAPQIKELFNIQDFSGALTLLSEYPNNDFKKEVRYLDSAVSFNLKGQSGQYLPGVDQTAKGKVIERIAIALWSESAFRERGQWTHWYLRVSGAFELAIFCLLENQSPEYFEWKNNENNEAQSELIYNKDNPVKFRFSIFKIVTQLLESGYGQENYNKQTIKYYINPVTVDPKWKDFKKFYTGVKKGKDKDIEKGWQLSKKFKTTFLELRNQLYHALQGDKIDNILDNQTKNLGSTKDSNHPAEIAVQYLHYVIKLAGISDPVQKRIKDYQTRVEKVKEQLEWIYTSY